MRQLIALMLKFPAGHTSPNLFLTGGTPKTDPAAGLSNLPALQVYIRTEWSHPPRQQTKVLAQQKVM